MSKIYRINEIDESLIGSNIEIHGRIHNIRALPKVCFIILRDQIHSIQCVISKPKQKKEVQIDTNIGPDPEIALFDKCTGLKTEAYVKIGGVIIQLPGNVKQVNFTSHKNFEFKITSIELISDTVLELPFALEDVNHLYDSKTDGHTDTSDKDEVESRRNKVHLHTRLNNRAFDLRAPFNNCIFKVQSGVCEFFRNYLTQEGFMEIHSPKIIGTPSEGGAAVFKVNYFGTDVFLAQSPQLYKQMCINADFNRVFEIGPVFRAENCASHRHLCEFVGLDIEMALSPNNGIGVDYHEIIRTFWGMLVHVFENINRKYQKDIDYIKSLHEFEDLKYSREPFILNFRDGVTLLQNAGFEQSFLDDLSTRNEWELGRLVKEQFGYDLFVLDKYPLCVRPFYTMPANDDIYSHSFDVIMRGQEISSGAQRINDYTQLTNRLKEMNLDPQYLYHYLESFKYGSRPHGGCGFGLERIVMLFLDLENVRETSLFPRDPTRVVP